METAVHGPPHPHNKISVQAAVMALARIITRSQMCSRELSLVLVARGYTVEIVSPDTVPDNIADLELRVEAGPANELIANVEAHNGGHTTSLEFVHHLKAPVLDFLRPSEPVSSIARQDNEDKAVRAEASQPSLSAVLPAVATLPYGKADPEIDDAESASLLAPLGLSPAREPLVYFSVKDATVLQPDLTLGRTVQQRTISRIMGRGTMFPSTPATQRRNRFAGWPWRAALAFAVVVLLAVVIGFGMRRSSTAAAQSSDVSPAGRTGAAAGGSSSKAAGAEKDSAINPGQVLAVPWDATDSEANSGHGPKAAQVVKSGTPTRSPRTAALRKRGDDLIARDTTVYFDKRYEPAAKAKPAKPTTHLRGGRGEDR
jgi:hypothetical protein